MKTILSLFILTTFSVLNPSSISKGYQIGDMVDNFKLQNIDGKMVSLSDYNNSKGVIVVFTCNTCPYAVAYEDRIVALDKAFAPKGYPVLAIMPNNIKVKPADDLSHMKKRAEEKGFTFPYLIDADQTVYPKFGATKTPHVYILKTTSKGHQVKYIGAIDDNFQDAQKVKTTYVADAVEALLNGKEVSISETRAIGCTIKV